MQRIFVGDVQGCADELIELVARATDAFGSEFAPWVAGDLVNRGPGNLAALELVRGPADEGTSRVRARKPRNTPEFGCLRFAAALRE